MSKITNFMTTYYYPIQDSKIIVITKDIFIINYNNKNKLFYRNKMSHQVRHAVLNGLIC